MGSAPDAKQRCYNDAHTEKCGAIFTVGRNNRNRRCDKCRRDPLTFAAQKKARKGYNGPSTAKNAEGINIGVVSTAAVSLDQPSTGGERAAEGRKGELLVWATEHITQLLLDSAEARKDRTRLEAEVEDRTRLGAEVVRLRGVSARQSALAVKVTASLKELSKAGGCPVPPTPTIDALLKLAEELALPDLLPTEEGKPTK